MAYANDIRFDQRNPTNTAYQEKYVSGSSLILRTDYSGSVVGTSTLEGVPIGTTTPSTANFTNVTASVISSSVLIGNFSGSLSGSNIIVNSITASNISASNSISASSAFFSLDVLISGVLKVVNKIYAYAGIIGDITGSLSGSNIIVNTITSSVITASNIISTNNDLFVVTSSVISSSTLTSNNNILVNVTSSNISASGYISGSNVYVENTITADTGSFIYFNLNNTGSAPTNYTSSGMPGEIRLDNNFIYIYTNNVWVRTPIVRWSD